MELRLAWMCGESLLPDSGGVLDQDAELMTKMKVTRNIYRTVTRLHSMQGAQIHALTDGERRMIKSLREGGYL
jgi:uncharacterized membrane protein